MSESFNYLSLLEKIVEVMQKYSISNFNFNQPTGLYWSVQITHFVKEDMNSILKQIVCATTKICKFIVLGFCQAQSQLQVKLSLKTELALIPINPAPTHPHPGKFNLKLISTHQ